ncbi:NADP-dependent oxidoreductase, partial [Streptomyces cyaneofuscatus]
MTTQRTARTLHLAARPHGFPTPDLFTVHEAPVPEPAPGTAVVENLYLSVDPYHREAWTRATDGLIEGPEKDVEQGKIRLGRAISREVGLRG